MNGILAPFAIPCTMSSTDTRHVSNDTYIIALHCRESSDPFPTFAYNVMSDLGTLAFDPAKNNLERTWHNTVEHAQDEMIRKIQRSLIST